ncbi:MAG: hypothetical protein ACOH2V_05785 [Candidatus Saccharimonadaceae bacterium]
MEWLAKGVEMVKSETYDKSGNLGSHAELIRLRE